MLYIEHLTGLSVTVFAKKNLLCRSVARLSPTLGDPMGCSTPGLPVFHYLPEFAQIKPSESLDVHNFIGMLCDGYNSMGAMKAFCRVSYASKSREAGALRPDLKMSVAMAPHSSTLAWKIPWMEKSGGLQSMGSWRVGTRLSDFTFTFHFHALEKEMATHSSVLAWRIPGTGEPGGLPSMGSHRVGQD